MTDRWEEHLHTVINHLSIMIPNTLKEKNDINHARITIKTLFLNTQNHKIKIIFTKKASNFFEAFRLSPNQ